MLLAKQLGMIPDWQRNASWPQNPNFNNHVTYPQGWNQLTVQPVGPNYAPPANLNGPRWPASGWTRNDCVCDSGREWCCHSLRGLGLGPTEPKWYIWAGTTLLVFAVLIGLSARKVK